MKKEEKLKVANGLKKADLVLKNGNIINVFSEEIIKGDIAICDNEIVGIGNYDGKKEIDCSNKFLTPGLIDAHMHIESSMLTPGELSKILVKAGTTTIIADPHEIVNVKGKIALDYILESTENILTNVFIMVPSAVPTTDFETNGCGEFLAKDMEKYINHPRILGLGETMRFLDVINGEKRMMDKIKLFKNKYIDGHSPNITGKMVQAYRLAGVLNDHECTTAEEGIEKLRAGFYIFMREGSGAKNVDALLDGFLKAKIPLDRCCFCTDDKHIAEIEKEGQVSTAIRKAIKKGVPVIKAYKMATYNTAMFYGLREYGALSAGYKADILIFDNLEDVKPIDIIKDGKLITEKDYQKDYSIKINKNLLDTVKIKNITESQIQLKCKDKNDIIQINPHQLLTTHLIEKLPSDKENNFIPNSEYNKLSVIERHGKTGEIAVAPIKGFNIKNGAIATSVAHDSHNIITAGDNDRDIVMAVNELKNIHGGYVIVSKGKVINELPLELCGLMSTKSSTEVQKILDDMLNKARNLGISNDIDPFITLSFMALTVIPEIRLTERGIFDVIKMKYIKNK